MTNRPEPTPPKIRLPVIPETIVVHLGPPKQPAENIEVSFSDYIKNVASSEIYPTWPAEALRANIYAQISFALNRIYTEWYRSRGYDFDITSSTQFDQAFVKDRDIFENISDLVDEIFNDYLRRPDRAEPLFAQFCSGTTVTCDGLSQWGSVTLANQGLDALEILQQYYGDNLELVEDAPIENLPESYPGVPLQLGDSSNDVYQIQQSLERIRRNFPAIPAVPVVDGVFDPDTQEAVRVFQQVFNMPVTGVVDKATWYRIKEIYTSVKRLADLYSEGIRLEEAELLYPGQLTIGDTGLPVSTIQYYLNVFAYFNPYIPAIPLDGIYSSDTAAAVEVFQRQYGLDPTGVTERATWYKMQEIYRGILSVVNAEFGEQGPAIYPGYLLSKGLENPDVEQLQTDLNKLSRILPEIPPVRVTGYFGEQTEEAVRALQKLYGIPVTGRVGALTWNTITYLCRKFRPEIAANSET